MKNFHREDLLFSLCGLNCALCPMKLDKYCPGCGGGAGNQGCAFARCSLQRGGLEYCYQCEAFPCPSYDGIEEFDSFITHRNQLGDMAKMKEIGVEAYHAELGEKAEMLHYLLRHFNDGRRKTFFCVAVNLLPLADCKEALEQIEASISSRELSLKERAAIGVKVFQAMAERRNIVLKLNKKPSKKGK